MKATGTETAGGASPAARGFRQEPPKFPVPPGGRGACARQPVQRDVVDDAVPGETAYGLAVDERAGDLVVAVRVVVAHPGSQPDG